MASKLIVNEIEHTDGAGTAVTVAKATIADATLTAPTIADLSNVSGTPSAINLANATFPAGHVLQVIYHSTATKIANTTEGANVELMEKAITPTKSSSKILVMVDWFEGQSNPNGAYRLLRNGTSITTGASYGGGSGFYALDDPAGQSQYSMESFSFSYLDSPSTTSATTYKLTTHSSTSVYFNQQLNGSGGAISTITLLEIAG